jgi:hypothetical protein
VWPALASISPSTHLVVCHFSGAAMFRGVCSPQSVRFSPNICILPRDLGPSRLSHCCASPRSYGRSSSKCHDDVKKSAAPWPAVSVYQYVSDAATAICLGKAIVFVLPLPHLASFPAFCVSLSALTTSAFPSYHRITITAWLQ